MKSLVSSAMIILVLGGCLSTPSVDGSDVSSDPDTSNPDVSTDSTSDSETNVDLGRDQDAVQDFGGDGADMGRVWMEASLMNRSLVTINNTTGAQLFDVPVFIKLDIITLPMVAYHDDQILGGEVIDDEGIWVTVPLLVQGQTTIHLYRNGTTTTQTPTPWNGYTTVHHFDAENFFDASGDRHGTTPNPPRFAPAIFGTGVDFSMVDNGQIEIPKFSEAYVDPGDVFTIDLWVKTPNDTTPFFFFRHECSGPIIQITGPEVLFDYDIDPDSCSSDDPTESVNMRVTNSNEWMHLGMVIDRKTNMLRAFRNGQSIGAESIDDMIVPDKTRGESFYIGGNRTDSFDGELDEVRTQITSRSRQWFQFQYLMGVSELVTISGEETF